MRTSATSTRPSTTRTPAPASTPPGTAGCGASRWTTWCRADEEAWAAFAAVARAEGYRHVLAAPLRSDEQTLGALNLFGRGPAAFDALDETVAALFAQLAALVLRGRDERQAAERRADQLAEAMRSRAVIEQAKGALAARDGGDPEAAFDALRDASSRTNVKLRVVAAEVVDRVARGLDPWGAGRPGSPTPSLRACGWWWRAAASSTRDAWTPTCRARSGCSWSRPTGR